MIHLFPDTRTLQAGQKGTAIYGGGLGSNEIFDLLRRTAGSSTSPQWDLFIINIYTLVRNAYTKEMSIQTIEKIIDTDVDLYTTFVGAYMSFKRQTPAVLLFYAPDYSAIPKGFLRDVSGQKQRVEIDTLYAATRKRLPLTLTEITETPILRKFVLATKGEMFPHKELVEHLRTIYGRRACGSIGTVMISHCPIDLHISRLLPNLQLLESYTATIYPISEFGKKLTKEVRIPFNTTTHRMFGDDIHLKSLVQGKQRKELIKIATDNNWMIRTEREIMGDCILKFQDIHESDLTNLRL